MKRTVTSIILMLAVVISNMAIGFVPQQASAADAGSAKQKAISTAGCVAAGLLTPLAEQGIQAGLKALGSDVDGMQDGILKSGLGGILKGLGGGGSGASQGGAGVLGGPIPVSDAAVASTIGAYSQTATRQQIITRCLALTIMNNMTNNILGVIKTGGRDGGPTFIANWINFQTNAQYRGENIFRAELSTAHICDYLSSDLKKSYGVDPTKKVPLTGQNTRSDSLQPFSLKANCTLPQGFTVQKYQQNFSALGGWDAFAKMLEFQNNVLGLTMLSQDEAQKQRSLAETADVNQVLANNGYTGVSGNGKADSCQVMGPTGQCLTFKDIKTTGSALSQNLGASIGAQFGWLLSAQGVGTIIDDFTQVMLNRLFDQSDNHTSPGSVGNSAYNPTPTQLTLPGTGTPSTTVPPCTAKTASLAQVAAAVAGDLNPGIGFTNISGQTTFKAAIQKANDALTQLNLDGATGSSKLEADYSVLIQAANDYFTSDSSADISLAHVQQTDRLATAFVQARTQATNTANALVQTCTASTSTTPTTTTTNTNSQSPGVQCVQSCSAQGIDSSTCNTACAGQQ